MDLRTGRESSQKQTTGNSLAVQWLGLSTFTVESCVQSLVGELRAHMLHSAVRKKKKKQNQNICIIIHSLNQSGMTVERL